jgi:hypothetical protein
VSHVQLGGIAVNILDYLDHVEVVSSNIPGMDTMLHVQPVWRGVDRCRIGGVLLAAKDTAKAQRLQRCMESGAAFDFVGIATDVAGQTFVHYNSRVYGRHLNADLKKLGY